MTFPAWYLIVGALLILMALSGSLLERLPLTAAMFYLAVGFALGPAVLDVLQLSSVHEYGILERVTEIAVIISLFTAGLKLRVPLDERRWVLPVRLASVSMVITVGLVSAIGMYVLGLPLGAAILLGAIVAPTDPVLASDVQIADPFDRDRLRFCLTGEAGLNDGSAFPFVMLGLGLLGLHDLGQAGWRWWSIDLAWSVIAGPAIGAVFGDLVARLVLYLRKEHREALGLDQFLTLGLIALSYGAALLLSANGFLAVFAAGIALRRVEMQHSGDRPPEEVRALADASDDDDVATHPASAPAYMAKSVLEFNEQIERIAELAVVVLLGALLGTTSFPPGTVWFVLLLLLVVRPLSAFIGLARSRSSLLQRCLVAWFGIRGVGSIYYLAYATRHGLPTELQGSISGFVLAVIAVSIVVHGISVTPLMNAYTSRH